MMRLATFSLLIASVVVFSASAEDAAKAYRNVSSDQLEAILKSMKVDFKKTAGKKEGIFFYDFEAESMKVRLHNYEGKDLWLDAHFTDKLDLDEVNKWNVKARATRAVLLGTGDKATVSLEAQLDCDAGASDAIVRQFVTRYEKELKNFVKFISK
ncbi:MAG: YbjN domain-containing protein [Gemmataceae bacterium]|nr:YbjN domain-containing protein [Gemmataceae bacterium]